MLSWIRGNGRWLVLGALVLLNLMLIALLLLRQTTISALPAEVVPASATWSGSPAGHSGLDIAEPHDVAGCRCSPPVGRELVADCLARRGGRLR
jgi:hypothetical protein